MAYRRPGVTVTQEFVATAPQLAALALPCVAVGPAYQIVNSDFIGTYSGVEQSYAYASLMGGALVDDSWPDSENPTPAMNKHISLLLRAAVLEILPQVNSGAGNGTSFTDSVLDVFENVLPGDKVIVHPLIGVEIVAARTDGQSSDGTGLRNRLTAPVANQFANVKIGDSVVITGGTNTVTGTFAVISKISNTVLVLSADINDGVGASANVAYSIEGDRGQANEGTYSVRTVVDHNTLVLASPLAEIEAPISYEIRRNLTADVAVERQEVLSTSGFIADDSSITMPLGYQVSGFSVLEANVFSSYRALRTDLTSVVRSYADVAAIEAVFGVGQIVPSNPLAYALAKMKENTVTPVRGLGLGASYVTDESLSYLAAADVLGLEDIYAIAPLTQNGAVHQALANHVTQYSDPERKLERVVIINSPLIPDMLLQSESVTSDSLVGARTVVGQQVDGSGAIASAAILNDATTDQFLSVALGDSVTITGGTGVTPGTYPVLSKQSNNQITLSSNFITAGSPTDIAYYIQRKDGISADGLKLYDRNALFLSLGVAAGAFVEILSGTYAGKHLVATVISEKELQFSTAILGITALETEVEYQVVRDLTKDEMADNVSGYSSSFSNRRVVHVWPDVVEAPVGNQVQPLPGYFAACAIAALTEGLPSQQGFTNTLLAGFIGVQHSTRYFREDQLNVIADGGTMVLSQDGPGQPLYVRHQLTTDRSQIKFQEYSVTKNVDFIAKFLRNTYRGPIGKYNIVDTTLDYLKTVAEASIKFLRDGTKRPFIGGVIRSGSLKLLEESADQIDTVKIRFGMSVPIPLNHIDITIEV
jgi:hypothetical protein